MNFPRTKTQKKLESRKKLVGLFLGSRGEHLRCWVLPLELESKTNTLSKNKSKGTKKTETNNPTQNTVAYYDPAFPPMEM